MFLVFLATQFYMNESVVNMREEPSFTAEIVSQAIFSENIEIERVEGDWAYIVTSDQYMGWVPASSFAATPEGYAGNFTVSRLSAHLYESKSVKFGPVMTLPYGAKLFGVEDNDTRWLKVLLPDGNEGYIQKGDVALEPELKTKQDLVALSYRFYGLPYTWGGRSSFGYDCSGFVQMLYGKLGINLQRDARQQVIDQRFKTILLDQIQAGDLIFFGKSLEEIYHVGMSIGGDKFIHATVNENKPWIHVSCLADLQWAGTPESCHPFRTIRQLIDD